MKEIIRLNDVKRFVVIKVITMTGLRILHEFH